MKERGNVLHEWHMYIVGVRLYCFFSLRKDDVRIMLMMFTKIQEVQDA
jgi:hypothetical protein